MIFSELLLQIDPSSTQSHSIFHLFSSSDPLVKITLFILLSFSVISWGIIFYKSIQFRKSKKNAESFFESFDRVSNLNEIFTQSIPKDGNPLYRIFSAGISDLLKQKERTPNQTEQLEQIKRQVYRSQNDEMEKLEQWTPFLATTASVTPFIGLFGTVWGILTAFWAIGKAGSSSLATVGPYISEALIATAVGLAAAIPAVIAYNFFMHKIKTLSKTLENFSEELIHRIQREYF